MEKRLGKQEKVDAGVLNPHGGDEIENKKLKRKISELEEELRVKDELLAIGARITKLKAAYRKANAQLWSFHQKHREDTDELQAVEKAFIQGFQNSRPAQNRDTVFLKAMGIFDPSEEWTAHIFGIYTSVEAGSVFAKGNEFVRYWEARVRDPDFDASICEEDEDGNLKYTIREDHEELNQVFENYGPEVYEAVCNAHLQVKEHGAGTTVLWHYGENRKATLSEVVERWNIRFEPKQ